MTIRARNLTKRRFRIAIEFNNILREYECCHLISSNHDQNYIKILRDHRVTHLVCATDPTYKTEDIEHEGVRFTSIPFPDGSPPTAEVNMPLW